MRQSRSLAPHDESLGAPTGKSQCTASGVCERVRTGGNPPLSYAGPGRSAIVFVVDDDAGMRASLRWLLESEGLSVETFESAEAFLAAHHPGVQACLLLDVRLPGMRGLALQQELAARKLALPVILMSGHSGAITPARLVQAGAVAFIEKPLDDELLLSCIRQALALL